MAGSACDTVQGVVRLKIREEGAGAGLSIYPNPASKVLSITNIGSYDLVEVFNILGSKQPITVVNRTANSTTITIEKLPVGVYLLKVTAPSGQQQSIQWVKE